MAGQSWTVTFAAQVWWKEGRLYWKSPPLPYDSAREWALQFAALVQMHWRMTHLRDARQHFERITTQRTSRWKREAAREAVRIFQPALSDATEQASKLRAVLGRRHASAAQRLVRLLSRHGGDGHYRLHCLETDAFVMGNLVGLPHTLCFVVEP